jgi:uncharacterized protein YidB (DUF937 family)
MGLLDDLIGSLTASDRNVSQHQADALVRGVLASLSGGGESGIDALARRLQGAGLGDAIASWIGTGANQSVPPAQLDRALRGSPFEELASRAGLGGMAGAAAMAVLLPKLIDALTPDGHVPQPDRLRDVAGRAGVDPLRGPGPFAQAAESGPPGGGARPKADFSGVQSGASSTAPAPVPREESYTVAAGDSLSKIAKRFYGDANLWKQIFEANRDRISDPDRIHPGQVLRIPR